MPTRAGLVHSLSVIAVLAVPVSCRYHHGKKKHHVHHKPSKFSAWDDLPDLDDSLVDDLDVRLGQLKQDLDSAILYQEMRDAETSYDQRRRRRALEMSQGTSPKGKVIGSALATGASKSQIYPALSSDWEADLINDDDDQLPKTFKAYAKDQSLKGKDIAPDLQSTDDFAEDYPVDEGNDQAEDAKFAREQEVQQEQVHEAEEDMKKARNVVFAKHIDLVSAENQTRKAKAKTEASKQKYSNATAAVNKTKAEMKSALLKEKKRKKLEKDIRSKIKKAERAENALNQQLQKQMMTCKTEHDKVFKLNASVAQKLGDLKTYEKTLYDSKKQEDLAKKAVQRSEKVLHDAQEMLKKLEAAAEDEDLKVASNDTEPTKSSATRYYWYILPSSISLALAATVLGLDRAW